MDFSVLSGYYGVFIQGAKTTIIISLVSLVIGFVLGLLICLMKMSKIKILRWPASAYVQILRGTPLFVQIFIIYFGLPQLGIQFPDIGPFSSDFVSGAFALSINSSAYIAEIFRSGIQAVDKGQMEASRSLGLGYVDAMRYVIVPQAVKNVLPALANEFITLVKESSIISVIGVQELMFKAGIVRTALYRPFEPYIMAAIMYLVMTTILSLLVGLLEKKLAQSN
ncbi:amino acid ABC transporter permease [Intestinibacter sp.]|uniref:amino acid ABC transporter permease n=1 Tax=Intestinibacter sp. TaxID=1965304 RepID=UPI002A75FDA7|nr:amino acid ABC transporter permease [Intestinibacter sp.]MDY2737300.1 amino acid ABC transporter permease [Intestinibacter sp.]MDY4574161.1 amino acid ABC transporter permease [Intestinibacter sp.]